MPPPPGEPPPGLKDLGHLGQLECTFHSLQLAGLADQSSFAQSMFGDMWLRPDGFVAKRPRRNTLMSFQACCPWPQAMAQEICRHYLQLTDMEGLNVPPFYLPRAQQ